MPEFQRLSGSSIGIELDFVEREQTPRELMELSIQLSCADYHFQILYLS